MLERHIQRVPRRKVRPIRRREKHAIENLLL